MDTCSRTIGRRRVRRICSSMSASSTELNTFADAADSVPPTKVITARPSGGNPPAARNMAGNVVTSNNSMMRGLVRPT